MNEMESKVKKYIVSVLTSSPLTMTISQLNKDYRNMLGEEIPYHKLGYNSMEHFLKSIPDTVQVKGSGPMATILPVISQKSKHINDLVTHQKVVKKKGSNRPTQQRKYLQSQKPTFTNFNNPPQPRKIFYPPSDSGPSFQSFAEKPVQNTFIPENDEKKYSVLNLETNKFSEKSPDIRQRIVDSHKPKTSLQVEEKSNVINSAGSGRTRKLPYLPNKISDEVGNIESRVPVTIRENLRSLIGQYENGIWCAELPRLYRLLYHKELNYEQLGYMSLIQLCTSLPSIFHFSRPSQGDFKLYDKSKPLPPNADKTFTLASYTVSNRNSSEETVSAVPNIDWDDVANFLPENVFKPGSEIPREFVPPNTKEEDSIKIAVWEVFDLSKFWVTLDNGLLDNLMDEMQDFYNANSSKYLMPDNLIKEGIYCVQIIYGDYHRAFIVDVLPDLPDTIRVLFIDYGTMTKVSTKGICFLHERFAELPAQAIRCRLADICPTEESVPWSREAISTFRRMVKNRNIDAKVARINWKDHILEAYLIDVTVSSDQFCLNTKLVEIGLAQYPDQGIRTSKVDSAYKPLVKYLHLFPTFLELEHGYAPSTQEMDILMNCEVPISLCYPQYFSIDHSDEKQTIKELDEFCIKYLKGKRNCKSSYLDMSCVTSKQLDLSIFKDIEDEIVEFIGHDAHGEYVDDDASEEISNLYKQLEELKKETAEKTQQERELAEDIMRDLDIIKYEGGYESCSEQFFSESDEDGDDGSETTMYSSRLTQNGDSSGDGRGVCQSKSGSEGRSSFSGVREKIGICDDQSSSGSKSTNPFLSDLGDGPESADEPLLLNPNNPFLPFLLGDVKQHNSPPASENSSNSTVYENYIEEVKVEQKWVNNENKEVKIEQRWLSNDNDVVSLVESLSITDATDTALKSEAPSMESHDCAIQTASEEPTVFSMPHRGPQPPPNLPYQPPQPHGDYAPWSNVADCARFGYGPRYPGSGYGYPEYMASMQPWMTQMLWRMHMRPQYNPAMGPAYQQQHQYPLQAPYQQQQQQCPFPQQFQPRGSLRPPPGFFPPLPPLTQVSSASLPSIFSERDFYEVYNEQLKKNCYKK